MKSPRIIILLLLAAATLHAAPEIEVQWTFEKAPAPIKTGYGYPDFKPPRTLKMTFPLDREYKVDHTTEIRGTTEFSPASEVENSGSFVIEPATPQTIDTFRLGYELDLRATRYLWPVSTKIGPYIHLVGTLTLRDARIEQGVFGEDSGPIYRNAEIDGKTKRVEVSPNVANMLRFLTATSFFQLNAIPGKTYTIALTDSLGAPIKVKVRCRLRL